MVVHAEDEDIVQFNYERFREEGRTEGANLHLVHNQLSEQLAFTRTIQVAKATGARTTQIVFGERQHLLRVLDSLENTALAAGRLAHERDASIHISKHLSRSIQKNATGIRQAHSAPFP